MREPAIQYCRVSSPRQVKEGHGLDAQEARGKQYVESKGYELQRVFKEEGVSGGLLDRPAMQKLLLFLEERPAYAPQIIVIVDDLSRWARDVGVHIELKKAICSRNARLECIAYKIEDSPTGKFVETVMAAHSEMWRGENRIKVIGNMRARLERGYWCFDVPPGYKYIKDKVHGKLLVPVEPQASIIKEALEGFASRRFATKTDVALFLKSREFQHRKKPQKEYVEQATRLLTRTLYAGWVEYAPWGIKARKGHHEGIIDLPTYERIKERLKERPRTPQRADLHKDFPLRGFVLCCECREPMTASWSSGRNKKYPYYRCDTRGCPLRDKSIRRDDIEDRFESMVGDMKPNSQILELTKAIVLDVWKRENDNVGQREKAKEDRIEELEELIEKCCDRIEQTNSERVVHRLEGRVDDMEHEKERLQQNLKSQETPGCDFETAVDVVFGFIKNPIKLWESDDILEQRLVPKLVFTENMAFTKGEGYETPRFSLLFELCRECECDHSRLVEMPGIEPGSKV